MAGRAHFGHSIKYDLMATGWNSAKRIDGLSLQNLPTIVGVNNFTETIGGADYFIVKADFFRMDNIRLGYDFSSLFKGKLNLNAYLSCQNAFTITGFPGINPDTNNGADTQYPLSRTFTLGLGFTF